MDYELRMSAEFIFLGVNNFLVFCLFVYLLFSALLANVLSVNKLMRQHKFSFNASPWIPLFHLIWLFPHLQHHCPPSIFYPHCHLSVWFCFVYVEIVKVVSNSLQPHGLYSPWNSPGQNTGVDSPSLLQGNFPTQGSDPGLLNCRWILYNLSH